MSAPDFFVQMRYEIITNKILQIYKIITTFVPLFCKRKCDGKLSD